MAEQTQQHIADLINLRNETHKVREAVKQFSEQQKELNDLVKQSGKKSDEYKRALKEVKEAQKEQTQALVKARQIKIQEDKAVEKLDKRIQDLAGGYKELNQNIKQTGQSLKEMGGLFNRSVSAFGAQTISLKNAYDATLKYNQGMMELQRTYQIFGRDSNEVNENLEKAFTAIRKGTVLSRNEFLELAGTFHEVYMGVKPLPTEIADYSEAMYRAYGPQADLNKITREFLGIQREMPALFDLVRQAQKASMKGNEEAAENWRKTMIMQAQAAGVSMDKIQEMLRSTKPMTEEQKNQVSLNKEVKQVAQSAEDTLIEMGKSGEEWMKKAANAAEHLVEVLEKIPGMTFAGATAGAVLPNIYGGIRSVETLYEGGRGMARGLGPKGMVGFGGGHGGMFGSKIGAGILSKGAGLGGYLGTNTLSLSGMGALGAGGLMAGSAVAGLAIGDLISKTDLYNDTINKLLGMEGDKAKGLEMTNFLDVGGIKPAIDFLNSAWKIAKQKNVQSDTQTKLQEKYQETLTGTRDYLKVGKQGGMTEFAYQKFLKEWETKKEKIREENKDLEEWRIQAKITKELARSAKEAKNVKDETEDSKRLASGRLKTEKDTSEAMLTQLANLQKMRQNYVKFLEIAQTVTGHMQKQIDISSGFLATSKEIIKAYQMRLKVTAKLAQGHVGVVTDEFQRQVNNLNLKGLDLRSSLTDPIERATEFLEKITPQLDEVQQKLNQARASNAGEEEISRLTSKYRTLSNASKQVSEVISNSAQVEQQAIMNTIQYAGAEYKQFQDINEILLQRINLERDLMEQAQFGMGASVAMMQKQVDTHYEILSLIQQRKRAKMEAAEEATEKQMGGEWLQQLAQLDSIYQAREMIIQKVGDEGNEYKTLIEYYKEMNQLTSEQAQHQKEIYSLTKDVREGYLDAIREMGTGAGEFEKIIGTQKMGVTQLMQSVKDATGIDKLNTMALGGMTEVTSASYKARQKTWGGYSKSGLYVNMSDAEEEARSKDIYMTEEARKIYLAIKRGERRSTVGTGVSMGASEGASREMAARRRSTDGTMTYDDMQTTGRLQMQSTYNSSGIRTSVRRGKAPGRDVPINFDEITEFARGQALNAEGIEANIRAALSRARGPMPVTGAGITPGVGSDSSNLGTLNIRVYLDEDLNASISSIKSEIIKLKTTLGR